MSKDIFGSVAVMLIEWKDQDENKHHKHVGIEQKDAGRDEGKS